MNSLIRSIGNGLRTAFAAVRSGFSASVDESPSWFRDRLSGFWFGSAWSWTKSKQIVNHDTALMNGTIFGCVRIIAEEASMLPLKFYRHQSDGEKVMVTDSVVGQLMKAPNPWQTEFEFREWMFACLALRGNAYAEIMPGRSMLVPLHPGRVRPEQLDDGRVVYHVTTNGGPTVVRQQYEIFHVRGLSKDGVVGLSPIELMRETIGLDESAREHAATFFANQSKPGGFIAPKNPITDEHMDALREDVKRFSESKDRYKTPVFSVDLDWKQIGLSNRDSQWLESRKFTRAEIAAIWRVPLHMLNDLDGAKFNNMELQDLSLLKHTLMPYLVRYEQRIGHTLIFSEDLPDEEGLFAEFKAEGLLRGDSKTRSEVYRTALGGPGTGAGWQTVNEVRALENLPLLDDPRADMVYLGETPTEPQSEDDSEPASPPPPETDESDEDQDEGTGNEASLQSLVPMICDVTGRLLRIEERNIGRRVKHAAEDPHRFRVWCEEYFEQRQTPLAQQEMKYLAEAAGCEDTVEHIAANYCIGRCDQVLAAVLKNDGEPWDQDAAIVLLTQELKQWQTMTAASA